MRSFSIYFVASLVLCFALDRRAESADDGQSQSQEQQSQDGTRPVGSVESSGPAAAGASSPNPSEDASPTRDDSTAEQEGGDSPGTNSRANQEDSELDALAAVAVVEAAPTDREIALGVENELLTSEAVDSHKLDATSDNGVVTLSGKVDNLLSKQTAFELAQRLRGVVAVVDQMIVMPEGRDDESISDDIRQAIVADPAAEAAEVDVTVQRRVATLSGEVTSYTERILLEKIVMSVRGLQEVKNELEVALLERTPDEEIERELEALFAADAVLSNAEIDVTVDDSNIELLGQVPTSYAKSHAEYLARHTGSRAVQAGGLQVNYEAQDGTLRRNRLEELTDEQIVDAVERALHYDPRVLSYLDTIEVDSDAGSVTLSGTVGRLSAKDAAERTARGTLGVWRVKNHIKVRWSDEDPTTEEIIAFVQAALKRDPYVTRHELRVHCRNGHVSLYGLVDSDFEKQAAQWIASTQKGVVHVNNYLSVAKEWEPKSDAEIQAEIEEKLKRTFFDESNEIRVQVEDGVAVLRGKVDTWRQWQMAMEKAIEAGARRPHNMLKVRYHPRHGGSRIYVPR